MQSLSTSRNGGGLTDADKHKIRSEIENARAIGYAGGVKAAKAKQHGTGTFRNTDGKLEWTEISLFVQREKHRLPVAPRVC
jgi:hypothetical protein